MLTWNVFCMSYIAQVYLCTLFVIILFREHYVYTPLLKVQIVIGIYTGRWLCAITDSNRLSLLRM